MYNDIGLRNHNAAIHNANNVVKKWEDSNDTVLKHMALSYKSAIDQLDILFKAANIVVNR